MNKFLIAILLLSVLPVTTKAEIADIDPLGETMTSCVDLSANMRYRMRDRNTNEGVSVLQDFLNAEGFLSVGPTGYFGTATLKAVKSFQSSFGISPTGFVGPLTRAKIKATTCGSTEGTTVTTVTTGSTTTTVPGCTSTMGYSPMTGRKCDSTTTVVAPEIILTANNVSDTLDIIENTSVTFSWNASNANSCSSSDGMSNWATSYKPTSGSVELKDPITVSRTYTITCRNSSGMSVSRSVRVNVKEDQSTTTTITVLSPTAGMVFTQGQPMTIAWQSVGNPNANYTVSYADPGPTIGTYSASQAHCDVANKCYISWTPNFTSSSLRVGIMDTVSKLYGEVSFTIAPATTAPTVTSFTVIDSNKWIGSKEFSWTTSNVSGNNTDYVDFIIDCANGLTIKNVVSGVTFPCGVKKYMPESTGFVLEIKNATNAPISITASVRAVGSPVSNPSSKIVYLTIPPATTTTTTTTSPTVEVIGTPTLLLQYDSARKESALVANYRVKITAGIQPLSFPSYSVNCGGGTPVSFSVLNSSRQVAPVTSCATGPTTIPSGTSATYQIKLTANPNQIFSGSYTATLEPGISSLDLSTGQWMTTPLPTPVLVGSLKTNAVTVIGERAPYLTSVVNDATSNVNITIAGMRFHATSNIVQIGGVSKTLASYNNGTTINTSMKDFGLTSAGVYAVQVTHPTEGASNVVNVNVTVTPTTTTTQPSITVTSPNGGEAWEIGNSYTIEWNQQNVDSVTIFLMRTSSLHGPTIASSYSVPITASTGSYTYTVPSNITLANTYKIWILGYKTGYGQANDWSDAPFGIVPVALGTTQPSSQFASVLGAFSSPSTNQTTSTPAPQWTYEWTRNLEVGSSYADDIIALQTALIKEGVYSVETSGGFYSQTYLGVKAFQEKYGIESTGFVGPITRAKLNELY